MCSIFNFHLLTLIDLIPQHPITPKRNNPSLIQDHIPASGWIPSLPEKDRKGTDLLL